MVGYLNAPGHIDARLSVYAHQPCTHEPRYECDAPGSARIPITSAHQRRGRPASAGSARPLLGKGRDESPSSVSYAGYLAISENVKPFSFSVSSFNFVSGPTTMAGLLSLPLPKLRSVR